MALQQLDRAAAARVDTAVTEAESKTSAEIVTILAEKSDTYLHVPYQGGLLGMALVVGVAVLVDWMRFGELPVMHVGYFVSLSIVGFLVGAMLARFDVFERWFAGDEIMRIETRERAHQLFVEHGLFRTSGRSAVLLYVSLFERMVVVLGDEACDQNLGQAFYDRVVDRMLSELQKGQLENAFVAGIQTAGEGLAQAFPKSAGDKNEIEDRLIVLGV